MTERIIRRDFLKLAGIAGGGLTLGIALAGKGPDIFTQEPPPEPLKEGRST